MVGHENVTRSHATGNSASYIRDWFTTTLIWRGGGDTADNIYMNGYAWFTAPRRSSHYHVIDVTPLRHQVNVFASHCYVGGNYVTEISRFG